MLRVARQPAAHIDQAVDRHAVVGYGSGLVQAEHIHAGKGLYALHVVEHYAALRKAHGAYRKRYACKKIQPFRDHSYGCRNHGHYAAGKVSARAEILLAEQRYAYGDYDDAYGAHYAAFEVLPPLKGTGTDKLFADIDKLREFNPAYINITTHHSEFVYKELENGQFERQRIRRRPGTVAIAAAIQQRYNIPVQPHVICSGATIEDIEYELLDLQFLGISDLLLLRGDKAKEDSRFVPTPGGHSHTTDLMKQVKRFNEGFFADGTPIKRPGKAFDYGVACYPEKHEEAPNLEMDMQYLKEKQDLGAQYAVTQLFFDNEKYFQFVERARKMGITIPIIPGIKPMAKLSQLTVVPKTFHCDIPEPLAREIVKCKTDEDARQLGIEWTIEQCRELYQHGIQNIHFYTVSAVDSVVEIVKKLG